MLRLIHQVSLPHLVAGWGRTMLVVGGITSGVSLLVAIGIINASVLENFRRTIELLAGPAALEVTLGVGEVGFDESTLDIVGSDPDVLAAVPLVRGTISLAGDPAQTLHLFGADLMAEEERRRYEFTTADRREIVRGLEDPRSILLTTDFASRHALQVGSAIKLSTPIGTADYRVRGLLKTDGLAAAYGGQLVVMDFAAAQVTLEKVGRLDQIDVMLRDGAEVETVRRRLASRLPDTLTVARPEYRSHAYERILEAFQTLLAGLSALCILAGVFIIYNTTSTAAVQRARSMSALRLIGAESATIFRLLILEALVLGAVGAVLGVGSGIVLARLLIGMVADSMSVAFQLRFHTHEITVDPPRLIAMAALGVGAALFGSYFAARRISRVDPLEAIRPSETRQISFAIRTLLICWAVLVGASIAALYVQVRLQSIAWGNVGSTIWNGSVLLIGIPLVSGSAPVLTKLLPRLFGVEGRVAAESLLRFPTRTGVMVSAVALMLALAITIASLTFSFQQSLISSFGEGGLFPGDLVVSAMTTDGGWLESPIPAGIADEITSLPGVRETRRWRALYGQMYRGERILLFALDDAFFEDPAYQGPRWYREGDAVEAAAALRSGDGVNVSTALADRWGLGVGKTIELDSPTGIVRLPIVGVVEDYLSDRGSVILSRSLLVQHWKEPSINRIHVFLDPGVSTDEGRALIAGRLGDRFRLKILTLREVVAGMSAHVARAFAFTDAIQLLVAIVTIAGIFDLLLATIGERRREFALWQVIGADERSVRRSVIVESATIGGMGVLLGGVVGATTAWIWVGINYRYLVGYYLEYHFATAATLRYVALVMVMTILSGYAAARHATRQSVLENVQAT